MALDKEILKEFVDIVGHGNINDGEVMTNAYSYNWCMEIFNYMEGKEPIPFSPIPKAVILPSSTEEVQKAVKLCNKYRIIVDVVGVSAPGDNNEMGLQTLGKLTDKTGGTLYLISSEEMEAIFSELGQMKYIGKDVKVKIIVPPKIIIKNITGAYSSKRAIKRSGINLGAITEDRELFLELFSTI